MNPEPLTALMRAGRKWARDWTLDPQVLKGEHPFLQPRGCDTTPFNARGKGGVFDAAKELATRTTTPDGQRSLEGDYARGRPPLRAIRPMLIGFSTGRVELLPMRSTPNIRRTI